MDDLLDKLGAVIFFTATAIAAAASTVSAAAAALATTTATALATTTSRATTTAAAASRAATTAALSCSRCSLGSWRRRRSCGGWRCWRGTIWRSRLLFLRHLELQALFAGCVSEHLDTTGVVKSAAVKHN